MFRGRWNSNRLTDAVLHRLSAAFPRVTWRVYLDSDETYASCDVYAAGLKTHALTASGSDYDQFRQEGEDFEFASDGVYNFLDALYARNEGGTGWGTVVPGIPCTSMLDSGKQPETLEEVLLDAHRREASMLTVLVAASNNYKNSKTLEAAKELVRLYESEMDIAAIIKSSTYSETFFSGLGDGSPSDLMPTGS